MVQRLLGSTASEERALVEELQGYLEDVAVGTDRIRQLMNDLRTFARPSSAERGPVDVHHALEGALRMAGHELRPRARVVKDYRADRPVLADLGRLMQVYVNLLVNAAQAITAPDERAEVRVATWVDDERVVTEVRDTGNGIPEEHLPRLFEPFFTTKPHGVGTGLGLSISRAIVESLNGAIHVETRVGVGSAFRVHLPAAHP
jgi:signal transduction histidine kinase